MFAMARMSNAIARPTPLAGTKRPERAVMVVLVEGASGTPQQDERSDARRRLCDWGEMRWERETPHDVYHVAWS